jgi:transposase
MSRNSTSLAIATIGLDIGKNIFHLVGLDKRGAIALRIKVSRGQVERRPTVSVGQPFCVVFERVRRRLSPERLRRCAL